jgi:hypothetical protein
VDMAEVEEEAVVAEGEDDVKLSDGTKKNQSDCFDPLAFLYPFCIFDQ